MFSLGTGCEVLSKSFAEYTVSANHPSTTVMRFSVRVPVLSEQMFVAFPIVSHAAIIRIKHWSWYIFFVKKASEIVTAKGRPNAS